MTEFARPWWWDSEPESQRPYYVESMRRMLDAEVGTLARWIDADVDACPGCGGGDLVRYCPVHGLNGMAPR